MGSGVNDRHSTNHLTNTNTVRFVPNGPNATVVASFVKENTERLTGTNPLSTAEACTINFWVKPFSSTGNGSVLKIDSEAADGQRFINGLMVNAAWYIYDNQNNFQNIVITSPALTATRWTMVTLTCSNLDRQLRVYFDGVFRGVTAALANPINFGTTAGISLGGAGQVTQYMSRTGVWNRIISQGTIESLYNSGTGKAYASLTAEDKKDLVNYWDLSEASGSRADSHGSNTLTDVNTVGSVTNTYPTNLPGSCGAFVAASSQSLSLADSATFEPTGDFSVAAWVKATTLPSAHRIIAKTAPSENGWALGYSSGRFRFTQPNGTGEANDGGAGVSVDTWYFVLGWRESGVWKLRVNATEYTGTTESGTLSNTGALRIGARNTTATEFWDGVISSVYYWNEALDSTDRNNLWNSGNGLFWPF